MGRTMVYKVNARRVLKELDKLVDKDEFEKTAKIVVPSKPAIKHLYVFTTRRLPTLETIFEGCDIKKYSIPTKVADFDDLDDEYAGQMEFILRHNERTHKHVAVIADPQPIAITMLMMALGEKSTVCKLYSAKDVIDLELLFQTIMAASIGASAAIDADCLSPQAPMYLKHYVGATKFASRKMSVLESSFTKIHHAYFTIMQDAYSRFSKQFILSK